MEKFTLRCDDKVKCNSNGHWLPFPRFNTDAVLNFFKSRGITNARNRGYDRSPQSSIPPFLKISISLAISFHSSHSMFLFLLSKTSLIFPAWTIFRSTRRARRVIGAGGERGVVLVSGLLCPLSHAKSTFLIPSSSRLISFSSTKLKECRSRRDWEEGGSWDVEDEFEFDDSELEEDEDDVDEDVEESRR